MDNQTTEILFGGGAGGAKSYLGVAFLIYTCGTCPGIRNLMGRSKLKSLKQTTLNTFFDVCKQWGIKEGDHYKYNAIEGLITFSNGSEIVLKDLFLYPADPNFDSLGSMEITHAFVDEANQVSVKARNIVASRQRYMLDKYKITPKLLMSCNPSKNHVYADFYKPWKDGKLPKYRQFVQALAKDNPYLPKSYIEQLTRLDKNSRERLLNGNWEFDDDPTRMFEFDAIQDLFTNKVLKPNKRYVQYLSVDVARHGTDKTVIMRWEGQQVRDVLTMARSGTNDIVDKVKKLCADFSIGRSHVVVDEDGVGGGVVDYLPGCYGFLNNGKVILAHDSQIRNFSNLKTQCYFKLADIVQSREIGVDECDPAIRDAIIEELEQIKEKAVDTEGKVSVIPKDDIRESLGRSPDFADAMMMRMVFELTDPGNLTDTSAIMYNGKNEHQTIGGNLFKEIF